MNPPASRPSTRGAHRHLTLPDAIPDARPSAGPQAGSDAGSDAGMVSLFLAVFFMTVLLLAGVVADAGRAVHANVDASDMAARAARAGTEHLDPAALRSGTTRIDPDAAREAAYAYLAAHHVAGDVTATTGQVTVTVTWPIRYTLLAALRPAATAAQTRTAVPVAGP